MKKYICFLFIFQGIILFSWNTIHAVKNNVNKKVSWSDHVNDQSKIPKKNKQKISVHCPEKACTLGTCAIFLVATLAANSAAIWGITAMDHASLVTDTITAYPYVPGGYANSSLVKPPIAKKPACSYQDYFHDHTNPNYTNGSCFYLQDEYSCIIENCSTIKHLYTKAKNTALVSALLSLVAKCSAIAGLTAWIKKEYHEFQKEPELSIDSAIFT